MTRYGAKVVRYKYTRVQRATLQCNAHDARYSKFSVQHAKFCTHVIKCGVESTKWSGGLRFEESDNQLILLRPSHTSTVLLIVVSSNVVSY